ncbi:MAG: bifunctional oligoribonuclease/PAP phosphatase NrnA [Eubacterium sp.]|nr:bifunctional oligoribonuclease/PAP phosphatase NrnA [Candidatus Colimonas fimequi]
MKNNASLREIGEILEKYDSVAVLPHISPDGDGLGASVALVGALRALGKEANVVLEEDVPEYIDFLNTEHVLNIVQGSDPCTEYRTGVRPHNGYAAIAVDCSEESRIPSRVELFKGAEVKLCVDHHMAKEGFGDYYYIDETAAAASELIYMLIDEMGWEMDVDAATALYTGIVTDTGSFQYSNTTRQTHDIAGALIEKGVNVNDVSVALFQNVPLRQIRTEARVLETLEIFANGKAGIAYVTQEMLDEMGATTDDTETVIDVIRNVTGVEIAAFLKEKMVAGEMAVKVSLRAKTDGNVQEIAAKFEGGGHRKAAGCTLYEDIETAVARLKEAIADSLEK